MRSEIGRWRALANTAFVVGVLGLAGLGILGVAERHWEWQETFRARAEFATVGGLEVGGQVRIQGMDAGVVEAIVPPKEPGQPVTLVLRIDQRLHPLVRSDATAQIVMQGVVGSRVVEIVPGRPDAPALAENGRLRTEAAPEVSDLLREASVTLRRVDSVAEAAERGLGEVNEIAATIRKGEGSLGRLLKDDEAYRKLVALSNSGERTLTDLNENLAALKRTWPLSRYFDGRAFYDREHVLFQPGSVRESQTVPESDLFEPGRAILTDQGRHRLDDLAAWLKQTLKSKSEIVIAAFTDESRDEGLAQILTQEQAEAVRKYLVSKYKVDTIGWFGSRKVAAVGFGTEVPSPDQEPGQHAPPRRVEIILFTPQT